MEMEPSPNDQDSDSLALARDESPTYGARLRSDSCVNAVIEAAHYAFSEPRYGHRRDGTPRRMYGGETVKRALSTSSDGVCLIDSRLGLRAVRTHAPDASETW